MSPITLESLCLPQPPAPGPPSPRLGWRRPGDRGADAASWQPCARPRGNVVQAARLLGLSRAALRHRLRRYGLQRPRERAPSPRPVGRPGRDTGAGDAWTHASAERPTAPSPAWEHKPVAVLAIELTFPTSDGGRGGGLRAVDRGQPLGAGAGGEGARVWRGRAAALAGAAVGGVWDSADAGAAAAARGTGGPGPPAAGGGGRDQAPCPALRLVVHWGEVLVDGQASDPTAQLRALGETLAWPVRSWVTRRRGRFCSRRRWGRWSRGGARCSPVRSSSQAGRRGRSRCQR